MNTISSNQVRKFAYDGLDHHTLLAARHDGQVGHKSVGRKRGFGEGEVEVTDTQTTARAVQRSLSRVRLKLRILASDNLSWVSPDPDFRHDGGTSTHSFTNMPPRVSNDKPVNFRPSPPPTHRPPRRSRLLHSSKISRRRLKLGHHS